MYIGAIEAGGTKFVIAILDEQGNIVERKSFPTTSPAETFQNIYQVLDAYELKAIGVGSFGPIDVDKNSSTYGYITSTPKLKWRNTDFLGPLKERYQLPISWTTDVNASVIGEYHYGAGQNTQHCVYFTIGTGVGAGIVVNDQLLTYNYHPEVGHLMAKRHPQDMEFAGICPSHGDCIEGLISGPAIQARWGKPAEELVNQAQVWEIEAYYLAQLIYNLQLVLRTERFILGGGVMHVPGLIDQVRDQVKKLNHDYIEMGDLNQLIVLPELGDNAAIMGCYYQAKQLLMN
ncbi:ROK family protein [Ignavigranum ruoffiae]|uniref:ROK family protein n=1 Tax=Ignavigranum ruoffiae TaxID=89093 RepID=UPI002356483A|nr:ROK family protein [Ignavigranum ruoffiae]